MAEPRPKLSEVIDVRPPGLALAGASSSILAKTATLEVRRLIIAGGREIPTHRAPGEITVHCLEDSSVLVEGPPRPAIGSLRRVALRGIPRDKP